jgi:3-deoxy-manno-octulosonate cytidylyltransferase (CMP-KDO synthetase)
MADPKVITIIPARMASTRLPGKPLADIAGLPMIVHVLRRAQDARTGEVVVATDSEAVFACVDKAGGRAIMTRADHVSGSDRIFEALASIDPEGECKIVLNVLQDRLGRAAAGEIDVAHGTERRTATQRTRTSRKTSVAAPLVSMPARTPIRSPELT